MLKERMENIYKNMDLDRIPWNMTRPPKLLTDFVSEHLEKKSGIIEPGCGAGNYIIYFSEMGYRTTGIDFCETAISYARRRSKEKGLDCSFLVADVTSDISVIDDEYDFAYDWELLHHIYPEHREKYLQNVKKLLKPEGFYLSVCFSEEDTLFGGEGKYRKTPLDTELYFSSLDEMRALFGSHFEVIHLSIKEIEGKPAPHKVVYAVLKNSKTGQDFQR